MFFEHKDVKLFYEKAGQGSPFILLHGNGESNKIFDQLIPQLSKDYTVYAIDSRGHGLSSKSKSLDYLVMAEDIAAFIKGLSIEKPILYGFSDGGILGLLIASRYPELINKLIISGTNLNPNGIKKFYLRWFRLIYSITRSPKYRLMLTQPNITGEELSKIQAKTLVLAGSNDVIDEKHTRYIAQHIPKSTLRILEGETHSSYVVHSSKLHEIVKGFF